MSSVAPRPGSPAPSRPSLRWSSWNLLLLVPLIVLVTPLYNAEEPRLFGFPYFYWLQFLFIPLGVLCVWVVYRMTGDTSGDADRIPSGDHREEH
ncbi:MAG: DUF3311 domain-containing protein [Pseudonocardiaceae bacterium]